MAREPLIKLEERVSLIESENRDLKRKLHSVVSDLNEVKSRLLSWTLMQSVKKKSAVKGY